MSLTTSQTTPQSVVGTTVLVENTPTLSQLADVDLQNVSSGSILIYKDNEFVASEISGDISMNADGVTTITLGSVLAPPWDVIENTPTTLSGYGITDAVDLTSDQTISGVKTFTDGIGAPNIITTEAIITSNSNTNPAVRITQTGDGNALVVEDETHPDSTPIAISSDGRLLIGTTDSSLIGSQNWHRSIQMIGTTFANSGLASACFTNQNQYPTINFGKSNGPNIGEYTIVTVGHGLGDMSFSGSDGVSLNNQAAQIRASVDATPDVGRIPGRLAFFTTAQTGGGDGNPSAAPVERMRIDSAGNVGIGTTSPSSKLHVAGNLTLSSATTATSATAGTNGDVPGQVAGYLTINLNGNSVLIPYYLPPTL